MRTASALSLALLAPLLWGCAGTGAEPGSSVDVREFVQRTYIHGVPYEEALRFGSDDGAVLARMLRDPAQEKHWANIAVTMCIIGDADCVDAVLDFIQDDDPPLVSTACYRAKTGAIMALGYAVHRSQDRRCFDFLEQGCSPSFWAENAAWHEAGGSRGAQRDRELSTMAILGLGLAGTPLSRAALEKLIDSPDPRYAALRDSEDLIRTAIATSRRIERIGLVEYYERGRH